ncbi:MAG: ABC transporter ATP-binding protein [Patescibacteria group bacterium]
MQVENQKIKQDMQVPFRQKMRAYRFFLGLIWRSNRGLAFFRFVLLVAGSFLQPLEVYVFSLLISAITSGRMEHAPLYILIVIASYGCRRLVNDATYSKVMDWFERSTGFATQFAIFDHISKLDPEVLERKKIRRSLDFIREELWRLNRLPDRTEWFIRSVLKLVFSLGLALVAPWWVTALVMFDALIQAANYWAESQSDLWAATWNSLEGRRFEYARYIFMMGKEFREMKLLGAAEAFLGRVKLATRNIVARFKIAAMRSLRNRLLLGVLHVAAYAIVLVVLGGRAFQGPEALAVLYVSINLFGLLGEALNGISGSVSQLSSDLGILVHVYNLFQVAAEDESGSRLPKQPLEIVFRDVSYRYPEAERDALSKINLTIRENEHLAIVGENGAGKSTFLRLLSGLDQPTSGQILVNGKLLSAYRKSEWRRAFHLMLQNANLFQDFVRENLTYGAPRKKTSRAFGLEQGVKISGADSVIHDLPEGLGTFLGHWVAPPEVVAHQVSGGQEQKLLIARTLIHGGRIIGFDEPTSAMDALAETSFFDRLNQVMQGRGLIFISHRFSTVRRAPRILVFEQGRLVDQGSHDELITRHGKYAELYNEQAKWYA